jgi:hypothetical protein
MKATAFDFFESHHLKLLFRLPFNSHSSSITKPKTTQSRQNMTMLSWKRCCKNSALLMNLTDMLPLCRAKNGPQNERTPNFGGTKYTNMKNGRYRVQMW